jgi:hypothetical protein
VISFALMPRLNYGTLLENIVVLESTRMCLDQSSADELLAFASAFAMPPLTECWCKAVDAANSPCFSETFLRQLSAKHVPPQTLEQYWSLCINNVPNAAIQRISGRTCPDLSRWGPNGALLACMLTAQRQRQIHLWINDNGERYGTVQPTPPSIEPDCSGTVSMAGLLVGTQGGGKASEIASWFPDTIPNLADWLAKGPGRARRFESASSIPTTTLKAKHGYRHPTIGTGFVSWLPTAHRFYPPPSAAARTEDHGTVHATNGSPLFTTTKLLFTLALWSSSTAISRQA